MGSAQPVFVTLVGGPTLLLELGGLRLLTDPTFSPAGPQESGGSSLTKLLPPALPAESLRPIDAVLLSHDQHPDNLDSAGRDFLTTVPLTISTDAAARRLPRATVTAVAPWRHTELRRPGGEPMVVTAVPAHHGPDGTEASSGPVIGFVLKADDLPTVYISGDNASTRVVEDIEHHLGPIDIAIVFAGAARTSRIDAYVSLTSRQVVEAARVLSSAMVIPAHMQGWVHFTERPAEIAAAVALAPEVAGRVLMLRPGVRTRVDPVPT